ncbi:ATP-binding protein [Candidatus Saccharibacteria bacterium]|nr:ATP-binding protein [Candidatus Saccharibacteria bacterium]
MSYVKRLVENRIKTALSASGAVFLRGAKACGKTETALRFAKSEINLQASTRNRILAEISPQDVLEGETPRLIDEWQEAPSIWNNVKIETDKRKATNQFILTGSATLGDKDKLHSGAGRIVTIDMSTLSWSELGYSNSSVSLGSLLDGKSVQPKQNPTELRTILERLVIGGWPGLIGKPERSATTINRSYIDLLLGDDISRVSGVNRNKQKAENILQSLARNTATVVDVSTIASDTERHDSSPTVSRQTTYEYLDDLSQLMILVNQPAWNVHIRSSASLRTTPKRHLMDPSLACATLGLSSESLFNDLNFSGFLFESQVFHDLSIYAAENDARTAYYRDSSGSEVDIIIEKRDGSWSAFEVKLGDIGLDEAAEKLLGFAQNIDKTKSKAPNSLNIITGTGLAYTRPDGVNVLPLSVIGA